MNPTVIVGTGLAGYGLAREFRKHDSDAPLLILSRDAGESYYKPNLSKALAAGKSADELTQATAAEMAERLNATVLTNHNVVAINSDQQELVLDGDQSPIAYSQLVLATGAQPIRIPLDGDAADKAISINTLDDYRQFRASLSDRARVLVMGAGLIGCEFANDLAANGHPVTVADPAAQLLSRLLPDLAASALRSALETIGVTFHLNAAVQRVDGGDTGGSNGPLSVMLTNGEQVEADVLLSAVGLKPDLSLANTAGIECVRGIRVDRHLQTSLPNIYALGDACEIDGLLLPYVAPITHAARTLGSILAGNDESLVYPAMPVIVKTPACPTIVCPPMQDGKWQVEGDSPDLLCRYLTPDGALAGFALTGEATKQRMALTREMPALLS